MTRAGTEGVREALGPANQSTLSLDKALPTGGAQYGERTGNGLAEQSSLHRRLSSRMQSGDLLPVMPGVSSAEGLSQHNSDDEDAILYGTVTPSKQRRLDNGQMQQQPAPGGGRGAKEFIPGIDCSASSPPAADYGGDAPPLTPPGIQQTVGKSPSGLPAFLAPAITPRTKQQVVEHKRAMAYGALHPPEAVKPLAPPPEPLACRPGEERLRDLLGTRRLALVLDLDHTLVNSVRCQATPLFSARKA